MANRRTRMSLQSARDTLQGERSDAHLSASNESAQVWRKRTAACPKQIAFGRSAGFVPKFGSKVPRVKPPGRSLHRRHLVADTAAEPKAKRQALKPVEAP